MGNYMSLGTFGRGAPAFQMLANKLYDRYKDFEGIDQFDKFHTAILDLFNKINASMIGMHYDPPSYNLIEEYFKKWKDEKNPEEKRKLFVELVENVCQSKTNTTIMVAGVVAPPAAMVLKKVGERVPQINKIKIIPDFVFVPSATMLTIFTVKFLQNNALKKR